MPLFSGAGAVVAAEAAVPDLLAEDAVELAVDVVATVGKSVNRR